VVQSGVKKADLIAALIVVCTSVFILLTIPAEISDWADPYGITGRTFPYAVSFLLLLLGIILAVRSGVTHIFKKTTRENTADDESEEALSKMQVKRVSIYSAAIGLYILGIIYVGFLVSSTAMIIFSVLFGGYWNKISLPLVAVITPLVIYAIFVTVMGTPLPRALLF